MDRILEIIERNRSFLITSHERLDGDALGTELALYAWLRQQGKMADIYNQDATPENYQFLPEVKSFSMSFPPSISMMRHLSWIAAM